jgi:NAD(P)-dependent dehydrogenase (short-subunit alcohol dehydrogenase family)
MSAPVIDMRDKVVVITGGNSGLGLATAIALAGRGATVVITARDQERGTAALAQIRAHARRDVAHCINLDLSNRTSIQNCAIEIASRFARLDVLINNAGVLLSTRSETDDGLETTFAVNHLGHFLLTVLLLDRLRRNAPARVVTVSSTAHWLVPFGLDFGDLQSTRNYQGMRAYAASKLANIQFTRELARRLEGTGVTANSLCPGLVASRFAGDGDTAGALQLLAQVSRPPAMSPELAAATPGHLAASPAVAGVSGRHFMLRVPAPVSWPAQDPGAARRLWDVSLALIGGAAPCRPAVS